MRPAATPADLGRAFAIRHAVFVSEQQVPVELERDERDAAARHVLAWFGDVPAGTGRLVAETPGYAGLSPDLGPVAHLGRIAVLVEYRRRGVGALLVVALEDQARRLGLSMVYLGAQVPAVGFYHRLGYQAYGAVFDDAGIDHRHMRRILGPTDGPRPAPLADER
ncbi:MAG: GNAT family N-acetyltransferase [Actinomycetes bacterium]